MPALETATLLQALSALRRAVELRDPYTAEHNRRVADLSFAIGQRMGMDADRLAGLRLAASLHDAGKIAVPLAVLGKPGHLAPEETRTHPAASRAGGRHPGRYRLSVASRAGDRTAP